VAFTGFATPLTVQGSSSAAMAVRTSITARSKAAWACFVTAWAECKTSCTFCKGGMGSGLGFADFAVWVSIFPISPK